MANTTRPLILAAATSAAAAASYWMYQTVSSYGWEGTLRYIWEGDPYSPRVREFMDILDDCENSKQQQEEVIWNIEEALERARLDSIDDDLPVVATRTAADSSSSSSATTNKEVVRLWIRNFAPIGGDLERSLAQLSHVLDELAAQVDSILVSMEVGADNSQTWNEIKKRKKLLSKQLVLDMERTDALMASYKVLQESKQQT